DDFLLKQGMNKGAMALIDEARAELIYDAMGPAVEISGGSAANTIVGLSSLGGRGAFVGKVKDDELGRAFSHDIRAAGVSFATPPASAGAPTGRCYVRRTRPRGGVRLCGGPPPASPQEPPFPAPPRIAFGPILFPT